MLYDYDLIVLGGGAGGLTSSAIASTLGARTLMVERARLGGDCTWHGCVPSKTLLKGARIARQIRNAGAYGLIDQSADVPFGRMMEYVRSVREEVYRDADAPERYEQLGVEVRFGNGRFLDAHTIEIQATGSVEHVSGRFVVVATGATAFVPPIPGLSEVPYLTNETLFEMDRQPDRLAILGAGPIGVEMAQAFARFGTQVTVVDILDRILPRDDEEMAGILGSRLEDEGVDLVLGARVAGVRAVNDGVSLTATASGEPVEIEADSLLVATGRRANIGLLNLDKAGVRTADGSIAVDRRCRTNVRHVYAVGDVTGQYQFTHMSEHMAKVAVSNALLKLPARVDNRNVPWVTFTDPEIAHVGASVQDLEKKGVRYRTYRFPYSMIDRAITDGETEGLIKVYARESTGRIFGVDIAGARAGELISEYALAIRNGLSLRNIADTIHPYPTYALGARRAADQWYVQKRAPWMTRLVKAVFRYRGPVLEFGEDDIL